MTICSLWNLSANEESFDSSNQRPVIRHKGLVVNSQNIRRSYGSTIQLSCIAEYDIQWVLPNNSDYANYIPPDKHRLAVKRRRGEEHHYRSDLMLDRLEPEDTGFYKCVRSMDRSNSAKNGEKVIFQSEAGLQEGESHVYLFVSSEEESDQLFLRWARDRLVVLKVGEDSVIDCRAIEPNATVSLDLDRTEEDFEYDPRFGFFVRSAFVDESLRLSSGHCRAYYDGKIDEMNFFVHIVHSFKPVVINITPDNDTLESQSFKGSAIVINCSTQVQHGDCNWTLPNSSDNDQARISSTYEMLGHHYTRILKIVSLNENDAGIYHCYCTNSIHSVTNHNSIDLRVRNTEAHVSILRSSNTEFVGSTPYLELLVDYEYFIPSHRPANRINVSWTHTQSTTENGQMTRFLSSNDVNIIKRIGIRPPFLTNSTIAYISPVDKSSSGRYTANVSVYDDFVVQSFNVFATFEPEIKLFLNVSTNTSSTSKIGHVDHTNLEENRRYTVYCIGEGYPVPNMSLEFLPCVTNDENNCRGIEYAEHFDRNSLSAKADSNVVTISEKNFTFQTTLIGYTIARFSGTFICATSDGSITKSLPYIVNDFPYSEDHPGMDVSRVGDKDNKSVFYTGSPLSLSCSVQKYVVTLNLEWVFKPMHTETIIEISRLPQLNLTFNSILEESVRSNKLILNVPKLELAHSGIYICVWKYKDKNTVLERSLSTTVNVTPSKMPFFGPSSTEEHFLANYSSEQTIFCDALGEPTPNVTWYKDDIPIDFESGLGVSLSADNKTITIGRTVEIDAGTYSCKLENYAGTNERAFTLRIKNRPSIKTSFIVLTILLIILLLLVVILVGFVAYLKRKDAIQKRQLADLYRGLMSSSDYKPKIDPAKPINDQIENLPYDFRYEIPLQYLKLGKILGEGQFGKVNEAFISVPQKADAVVVAAKQPKNGMDVEHQNALISELKMMIYIESHVNVLSLVGAVTKRMAHGQLYVLVEYCKLGSLGDFLKNHRATFVDELVAGAATDGTENPAQRYLDITTLANQNESAGERDRLIEDEGYLTPAQLVGAAKNDRSKYQGEIDEQWSLELSQNKLSKTFVCTSDLLSYSYQIANGMEYLASKNLLHRDLAVRNLLLTDNHVVKICDFGLARHDESYQIKKLDVPLPVRWMALESILDQEYTVKSDVWSFGVVLWEIFALGELPYSGQQINRSFIQWLKAGNRLERPRNSPKEIYDLMLKCWSRDPKSRPSFKICKDVIGEQLKFCCRRWYDDLVDILNDKESTSNYSTLRNSLIHFDQENNETSKLISPMTTTNDLQDNSGNDKVEISPRGDVYYNCSTLTTPENV